MTAFTTTLNKIRAHRPCTEGWQKLLAHLGKTKADDEPLSLLTILESNGLDDALWCARAIDGHDRDFRLLAVWCVRMAQHLIDDPRSVAVLDVAERYANGQATDEELAAAKSVARGEAWYEAWYAACGEAWYAAWGASRAAASASAWSESWSEARSAQEARLRKMIADGGWIGGTQ